MFLDFSLVFFVSPMRLFVSPLCSLFLPCLCLSFGEDLHCNDVFSGTFHGYYGDSELVEGCETGVLEGSRMQPRLKGSEVAQSDGADIGDVQVVRIMYPLAFGEGKRA